MTQKTPAQIQTEINQEIVPGIPGGITATTTNHILIDIAQSYEPIGGGIISAGSTQTIGFPANELLYSDGTLVQGATVGANLTLSGGVLSATGGGGGAGSANFINTVAEFEATSIASIVQTVYVLNYAVEGDLLDNPIVLNRIASQPSHPACLQSADGQWWVFINAEFDACMWGAVPGKSFNGYNANDDTAAFVAMTTASAALGRNMRTQPGVYEVNQTLLMPTTGLGLTWSTVTAACIIRNSGMINGLIMSSNNNLIGVGFFGLYDTVNPTPTVSAETVGITIAGGFCNINSVIVQGYNGPGIDITDIPTGFADNNYLYNTNCWFNRGSGFREHWGNGNVNTFVGCNASWNGIFGIEDRCFLGSFFFGTNGNGNGSFGPSNAYGYVQQGYLVSYAGNTWIAIPREYWASGYASDPDYGAIVPGTNSSVWGLYQLGTAIGAQNWVSGTPYYPGGMFAGPDSNNSGTILGLYIEGGQVSFLNSKFVALGGAGCPDSPSVTGYQCGTTSAYDPENNYGITTTIGNPNPSAAANVFIYNMANFSVTDYNSGSPFSGGVTWVLKTDSYYFGSYSFSANAFGPFGIFYGKPPGLPQYNNSVLVGGNGGNGSINAGGIILMASSYLNGTINEVMISASNTTGPAYQGSALTSQLILATQRTNQNAPWAYRCITAGTNGSGGTAVWQPILSGSAAVASNTDSSTSSYTMTASECSGVSSTNERIPYPKAVLYLTGTLGAGATITLPTLADIQAYLPDIIPGSTWILRIINSSSANFAWTVAAGPAWSLTGTASIAQNTWKEYIMSCLTSTTFSAKYMGGGTY